MIPPKVYFSFRWLIICLAILPQLYLFLRIRRAIRASRRSKRFRAWATRLVGVTVALLFAMNGYIIFKPVTWVDPPAAAEFLLFYPPVVWSFASIITALLLGLTQLMGATGRIAVRGYRGLVNRRSASPVNLERRHFIQAGVGGLAAAPLVLSGYGAAYASKAYEVRELTLPFGCSLRVVQLSDIHAGLFMSREEMRHVADQVNRLQPDLFVLTGDYISNSMKFLPGCVEEMSRVRARYGTFAIMGNHECWYGEPREVQAIFRQHRITFLLNTHKVIASKPGPFAVAGIDDLQAGYPDLEAALQGLDGAIPTILLSHRPEVFPKAAARRIPLTLAGHYHGGQIKLKLPGLDLSLARLRTLYVEGLFRRQDSHLYVNRGIGTTVTPIRLNTRPEVTVLNLT
jgi:predicted MPP superfamily phosphohydrolase